MEGRKRAAALLGAALALAGCGYGVTSPASSVRDTTAQLNGLADRTEPGGIEWWFEYGPTTDYGSTTRVDSYYVTGPVPVAFTAKDLAPETTYHYRLCVRDVEDDGPADSCGGDSTFVTRAAGDHVSGLIEISRLFPEPFHVGIRVDAFSDADGANATGGARAYADDYVVEGAVVCTRVAGNRVAIGFRTAEGADWVISVYDNGSSGDSFDAAGAPGGTLTQCPQPPPGPYANVSNFGNIQLIDTP